MTRVIAVFEKTWITLFQGRGLTFSGQKDKEHKSFQAKYGLIEEE